MTYKLKDLNKDEFYSFQHNYTGQKTFLQSGAYYQWRSTLNESIFLKGIVKNQDLVGVALIQKVKTKLKTFLHCPHGPLVNNNEPQAWNFFLQEYKKLGKSQKCDFVRISPLLQVETADIISSFKSENYQDAPIHLVNPEHSLLLDITQDEEAILAQMRKSTRYEVRRIEKCQIEVTQGNTTKDLDVFWNLHLETVARQGFVPFPRKITEAQLETFGSDCQIFSSFLLEEDKKQYYSSAIIIFDEESAYYHQGSSIRHKFPVAHAPLWAAIKEAKARGCKVFNFWGIVGEEAKAHPWYGLSKFKKGFGGYEEEYLHCQDFPLTWKYHLNTLIEKYRKIKRGY